MADVFWCLMAAQRSHGIEETADKLLEVSAKAQENARRHDEAMRSSPQNAAGAVERGRTWGRG